MLLPLRVLGFCSLSFLAGAGSVAAGDRDLPPITEYSVGSAIPVISSTYDMHPQIEVLPDEPHPKIIPIVTLPPKEGDRSRPPRKMYAGFNGLSQTPFSPPDPSLAVGPANIVQVVNTSIAFYTKTGVLQFSKPLDSSGNPGFFEDVGAGNFVFDPKCLYDDHTDRFFVIALELYTNTAFLDFAISDDSDPNGTWYKYRQSVKTTINSVNYWVDYPGLGVNLDAFTVNGNLFDFGGAFFGGTKYRVIVKSSILNGGIATTFDLRDANAYAMQGAYVHSTVAGPFLVGHEDNIPGELRVQAITGQTTAPVLNTTIKSVDDWNPPPDAPTKNGSNISTLDGRIINADLRNKHLFAAHGVDATGGGTRCVARWYELGINNWPTSGNVSLIQQGDVDLGSGLHAFFPTVARDSLDYVAMVFARSGSTEFPGIWYTRRHLTDPTGTMEAPRQLKAGVAGYNGYRWGDYFGIGVDPVLDKGFFGVGEYATNVNSWSTFIGTLGFNVGSVVYFEPGCAGSGGLIPVLDVTQPVIGTKLDVKISNSIGGAPFYFVVGFYRSTSQLKGCDLFIGFPWILIGPLVMGGSGTPGGGSFTLSPTLQNEPSIVGFAPLIQTLILDSGAPLGLSTTRAAQLFIGDITQ